jgi:glycosyltransferase involved in cell wall biosynthesis
MLAKSEIKVSIILPIHNAGIHLQKCLDTLINQTLKDIEIVAVLDCPTDGSDKIVETYAAKDNRLVIVKNEQNMHIGYSRNKGLEKAKGKYIGFSDHDDYRELTMYEELYNKMEKGLYDLLTCSFATVHSSTVVNRLYPIDNNYDIEDLKKSAIGSALDDVTHKHCLSGVWNKLFRHDIIKKNNIQFIDTKKSLREDVAFIIEYGLCIRTVGVIQKVLYYHQIGIGNTGVSFDYRKPQNGIYYLDYINKLLHKNYAFEKYKLQYYNTVQHIILESMFFYLKKKNILLFVQSMFYYRRYSLVKEAFSNYKIIITNPSKVKLFAVKVGRLLYR